MRKRSTVVNEIIEGYEAGQITEEEARSSLLSFGLSTSDINTLIKEAKHGKDLNRT